MSDVHPGLLAWRRCGGAESGPIDKRLCLWLSGVSTIPASFRWTSHPMNWGKSPTSTIFLDNPYISRRHSLISRRGDHYEIEDLGSKNGTSVNGRQVTRRRRLSFGDHIELGRGPGWFFGSSAWDPLLPCRPTVKLRRRD